MRFYFDPNSCHYNGGKCPKCPGHCRRYAHIKIDKYIVYDEKEEECILEAKKSCYEEGLRKLSAYKQIINGIIEDMRKEENEISKRFNEIKTILEELNKISLKPVNYYKAEIFQLMINEEEAQKNIGWQKRIEGIKNIERNRKTIRYTKKS